MSKLCDLSVGEITQSLLALLVVVGGGVMVAFIPDTRETVVGLMGLVIGFYFNRANGQAVRQKANQPPVENGEKEKGS